MVPPSAASALEAEVQSWHAAYFNDCNDGTACIRDGSRCVSEGVGYGMLITVADEDQESFDKQMVRDWLDEQGWNRSPPAPVIAPEIVERTTATYREIHRRITGNDL